MTAAPSKAQRQHRIARLLEEHRVTNQAHLVELLAADGVEVNVSTVSRDLEELGAIKVRIPGGETAYAVPELPREQVAPPDHLRRVLGRLGGRGRTGPVTWSWSAPRRGPPTWSAPPSTGPACRACSGTIAGDDTLLLISTEGDGRVGGRAGPRPRRPDLIARHSRTSPTRALTRTGANTHGTTSRAGLLRRPRHLGRGPLDDRAPRGRGHLPVRRRRPGGHPRRATGRRRSAPGRSPTRSSTSARSSPATSWRRSSRRTRCTRASTRWCRRSRDR